MNRTLLISAAAVAAIAVAAGVWLWPRPAVPVAAEAPRPVVTAFASPAPAAAGTFVGTVEATVTVGIAFEVLGRLTARPVNEGDLVAAGDILASIDAQALRDDRDAARAALASAEATLTTTGRALARTQELVQRGAESDAALEAAQRNDAVARARAEQARAQLARAEDAVTRADLTAPMDGIVIQTRHDPGTTVAAGDPVLVLASPAGRKVALTLPASILTDLAPGAPFRIHAPELPGGGIAGTLLRIDPVSVSETRMRAAEIALGPEAERLVIGQLVEVSPDAAGGDSIAVPPEAITERDGIQLVWVVETADGARRVHSRTVTPGRLAGDGRVTVGGLSDGTEVVVRGLNTLAEGMAVGPAATLPGQTATPRLIIGEGDE